METSYRSCRFDHLALFVICLSLFTCLPRASATNDKISSQTNEADNGAQDERYLKGDKEESGQGQVLTDNEGNSFMEEVPEHGPKRTMPSQRSSAVDLRTVDVAVDPNGNIVPLINKQTGRVLPFYSSFEQTVEPLWQFAPAYPPGYIFAPGGPGLYGAYPGLNPGYAYPGPYPVYPYPSNPSASNYYPGQGNFTAPPSNRWTNQFGNRMLVPQAVQPGAQPRLQPSPSTINPWFTTPPLGRSSTLAPARYQ